MNPHAKYNADTHTFTINVGDSVKLDAKTTGYIKNVSWATNAWDRSRIYKWITYTNQC